MAVDPVTLHAQSAGELGCVDQGGAVKVSVIEELDDPGAIASIVAGSSSIGVRSIRH